MYESVWACDTVYAVWSIIYLSLPKEGIVYKYHPLERRAEGYKRPPTASLLYTGIIVGLSSQLLSHGKSVCVCAVFVGRCVLWLWGCCNCFDEINNSFSPAHHLKAQIFSIFAGGMKRWHNFYLIVCQQLFCCLNCFFLQRCLILFIHLFWHAVLPEQTCSFCFTSPVFVLKKAPKKAKKRAAEGANSNVFSMFEQAQIQEFKEVNAAETTFYFTDFHLAENCREISQRVY